MNSNMKEFFGDLMIFIIKGIGKLGFYFFIILFVIDPLLVIYYEYQNGHLDGGMYSNHVIIMTLLQIAAGFFFSVSIKKVCMSIIAEMAEVRNYHRIRYYEKAGYQLPILQRLTALE